MSVPHASPGELIDVTPLGTALTSEKTRTLFKSEKMEMLRLILPAGKVIPEHKAPGEITVQCLEGLVAFRTGDQAVNLAAGQLLCLSAKQPHAVEAIEDSSVLVTILLDK